MAAAGLWTTPTDLARLTIEVALSTKGRSNKVVSAPLAREMLSAQPATNGEATLGFFIDPKQPSAFVNNGADRGFQTMLRMDTDTGQGAVIMANSENGFLVATEYMEAIANAYGWKVMPAKRRGGRYLVLVAKLKGIDAALATYDELKRAPNEKDRPNELILGMLGDRLFEGGDKQSAIKALEKNAMEYPTSAAVNLSLGKAYAATSQQDRAIESFEKSLALDPAMVEARNELAKFRPPDIAPFLGGNSGFGVPGVRTNTCPVFELGRG
jgi:tetratricopeptide (TPR) repeat protein